MKTKSVRAKKATASRTVRYLLFADRTLQKLSLRRVPAPEKQAKRAKKAPSAMRSARRSRTRESRPLSWVFNQRYALIGATCVVGAAALIGVRKPTHAVDNTFVDAPSAMRPTVELAAPPEQEPQQLAALAEPKTPVAPAAATKPAPAKPAPDANVVPPSTHVVAAFDEPVKPAPVPVAAAPAADSTKIAAVESTAKMPDADRASVTITGCLQLSDQTFWLKDTAGADAPTSRSWKSGFLKKRPARIEVVDATRALRLANYVGQRVAATGTLVNREMQTRSVLPIAAACS
jgi:hypothetical protein